MEDKPSKNHEEESDVTEIDPLCDVAKVNTLQCNMGTHFVCSAQQTLAQVQHEFLRYAEIHYGGIYITGGITTLNMRIRYTRTCGGAKTT